MEKPKKTMEGKTQSKRETKKALVHHQDGQRLKKSKKNFKKKTFLFRSMRVWRERKGWFGEMVGDSFPP